MEQTAIEFWQRQKQLLRVKKEQQIDRIRRAVIGEVTELMYKNEQQNRAM